MQLKRGENSKKKASPDANWNLLWYKTKLNSLNYSLNYYICIWIRFTGLNWIIKSGLIWPANQLAAKQPECETRPDHVEDTQPKLDEASSLEALPEYSLYK